MCATRSSADIAADLERSLAAAGLGNSARVVRVGCLGLCDSGPAVVVVPDGTIYLGVRGREESDLIVREHLVAGRPVEALEFTQEAPDGGLLRGWEAPFFSRQRRVVLRNCGVVDPSSIADYIALDGYSAVAGILAERGQERALATLARAGVQDDGDGGCSLAAVWAAAGMPSRTPRYVVCNATPRDPPAAIARRVIESDPHSVIEGVLLAGLIVGARRGFVYCPEDAGLAIERLDGALRQARRLGLVGEDVLGSGATFDVETIVGPGGIVLTERTALVASLEGRRPVPGPRLREGSTSRLWGRPALIHGVEPLVRAVAVVAGSTLERDPERDLSVFASRVLALRGAVRRTGTVEVPPDISLEALVDAIAGGSASGTTYKVVHLGGATGGCAAPPRNGGDGGLDRLESRAGVSRSGTLAVYDGACCVVDLAKACLEVAVDESCGKCPPCRVGTRVMISLLERISRGEGTAADVDALESLGRHVQRTSLCRVGQRAPGPVLTALRDFRAEFVAHVAEGRCPAGRCSVRPKAAATGPRDRGLPA
jgi:NADP-reducing hydrogenase subunit HndC